MPTSVALIASVVLVLLNAFFVASEFSIVKMRPSRVAELALSGSRRARIAAAVSRRLDAYLSANQLGITLASLGLGWLGEPAFADLLEPLFAGLGWWSSVTAHSLAIAVSLAVITFLHTVLGELAPKSLAIQRTEAVALWTATPLRLFYIAMFPVIWALNSAAALTLRLLGLPRPTEVEMLHSPDELRLIVQHGALDPEARRAIDRALDYPQRVARHVMTLRQDVVVVDAAASWDDNVELMLGAQYTRYPVICGTRDRVLGYVHLKDLLSAMRAPSPPSDIRQLMRAPVRASGDAPLEQLRRDFRSQRALLAVIEGPDQSFEGIVTLEDVLEELVGEIQDEQDGDEIPPIIRGNGGYDVDGRITLDVAARELDLKLTDAPQGVDTLAGYVESQLAGTEPVPGDAIVRDGFRIRVIETRDRRAPRLHVSRVAK